MVFLGRGCYPCSRLLMNSLVAIRNNSASFRLLSRANPINLACSASIIPIVRRDFLFSSSDNKGRPTSFFCFPDIVCSSKIIMVREESVAIGSPSPIICVFSSSNTTSSTKLSNYRSLDNSMFSGRLRPAMHNLNFTPTRFPDPKPPTTAAILISPLSSLSSSDEKQL